MRRVITILSDSRVAIAELCRRFKVRRLEVFGSAVDGTFHPESSDIDFLVEYSRLASGEAYDVYFGLLESLQELFQRRIDLVDVECLTNPYFVAGVNRSRKVIYDARSADVSV